MKKKSLLLIPLLVLAMTACGTSKQPDSNPNKDPDTNIPGGNEGDTDNGGGTDNPGGNEGDSGNEGNPNEGEKLPNGLLKLSAPDNMDNPISLKHEETLKFDCTKEVPEHWSYLYPNKKGYDYNNNHTDGEGEFYQAYNKNISMAMGRDLNHGIQTPALARASKYEIGFQINELHGSHEHCTGKNKEKPNFLVYGFDENEKLIYQQEELVLKNGVDKKSKNPNYHFSIYVQNPDVRYIEIRMINRIHSNEKDSFYVNFGLGELYLKFFHF